MLIRSERASDFEAIYRMVKLAFEKAPITDGDEHDYINLLRADKGYLPDLALVAEEDEKLIGHVMLIETRVVSGREWFSTLLLEPLSVAVGFHNRGVGSALIKEALRRAEATGYESVFLTGDVAFYQRFGFKVAPTEYGINHALDVPAEYLLGLELKPGALKKKSGLIEIL